jgi:hypothetical protein
MSVRNISKTSENKAPISEQDEILIDIPEEEFVFEVDYDEA